jgi:hypothetical protein
VKAFSFLALSKIGKLIDERFESIGHKFLGLIPRRKGARIIFDAEPNSLTSLFMEALGDSEPTKPEEDTLKSLLMIADSYVNALKEKTKAQVLHDINAYVGDRRADNKPINTSQVKKIFDEKMDKAKEHFTLVAGQESNKALNVGKGLQISKIAESAGDDDPTCLFVVTVDDKTGPYEFILHLLPDGKTPRLWKLSEITGSYFKPGDQYPSFSGLHIWCRCKISYLPKGYGFGTDGKIKFIAKDHDEFKIQREKYGLPEVPKKISKKKQKPS